MNKTRLLAALGLGGTLLGHSMCVSAAGFAIAEQSVSGLGNAFAGGAASAEDASTIFYNPAGMTRLEGNQFIGGFHVVRPSYKFDDDNSTVTFPSNTARITGGNGDDGGQTLAVPNIYYKHAVNDRIALGIGINSPFGLETDYGADWVGRYHTIKGELKTLNINPAVAYKVWKGLSLGAGVSAMYGDIELHRAVDSCAPVGSPGACDTLLRLNSADDWAYTYNAGILYEFSPNSRIGAHYRSKTDLKFKNADARFDLSPTTPPALAQSLRSLGLINTQAEAKLQLPDSASLSVYHAFNPRWALMADGTWTHWSRLGTVDIDFDSGITTPIDFNYKNTWRVALGGTYTTENAFIWRAGVAFDQSPVKGSKTRLAFLPDEDRIWAAFGVSVPAGESFRLDVSYAHLFIDKPKIDSTVSSFNDTVQHTLDGEFSADANIFAAQLVYTF